MLDTIHFCGFNTSLEAFAVGTPVVTLPGEFQRGRHTLAFYKEMGLLDCVADSPGRYVEIAVRLGTDRVYREAVKAKILAHHQVLYENADVIREFERFFVGAVEDARSEVVQKAGGVLPGKPDQPTAGHETVRGTVTRALTSSGALSEPAVGRAGRLVDDCRRQIMNTIPPVIPKERRLALIDFPDYPNCGDHAIWAGEKALLRFLGIAPVYECSMTSYDEEALRAELKDGVILMQGGGNFGDIYVYQKFRERVIASFPHNEIIIFPQSVKFKYQDQLDRSKAVFRKHGHVTIVARDADSFNFLERHFTCPRVLLCPDMAFMLGMLNRPVQPCVDILYLCRSDDESRYAKGTALGFDRSQCRRTINRLPPFPGTRYEIPLAVECIDNLEITDWHDVALGFPSRLDGAAFFDHMSAAMTDYAMKILSRGRVVVSDRLHAHILCLLLNIPHVLIENSYGKLGSFYKTWTSGSDITHWAENPRDAISVANTLVQGASKSK
jgi:pyruvyl transferase EpsO